MILSRRTAISGLLFAAAGIALIYLSGEVPYGAGVSFLYGIFLWVGWWFLLMGLSYFPWPMKLRRFASVCRRALLLITLCGLLALAAAEIAIFSGSKETPDEGYGAVIILGAGLHGERPSAVLYSRLESGLELLNKNPEAVAVLCGGQGGGEYITEAEAMRRYLAENGVAADRMLLEERSTDTHENLLFAKELLARKFGEAPPAVVVTNDFHITRSLLLARKAGLTVSGVGAYTPQEGAMRLSLYLREGFALVYAAVFREI